MSGSMIRHLVVKDLRLQAPLVAGSFAAGLVSLAAMPWSRVAFYVGSIAFMVTLVLLNVLVVSSSLINERKDKTRLLMLSLPVSTMQYNVAKLLSSLLAFLAPATVLTACAVALLYFTPLPNGFIPFTVAVFVHCLLYFCVFLAVALVTDSAGWMTTVIVAGNVSLTFVIQLLLALPSLQGNLAGPVTVWGTDVVSLIAIELVLGFVALAVSFIVYSRKTEFV
jgi:ABC-type transport system involved in multi-copper enzyme maturation permease subunit